MLSVVSWYLEMGVMIPKKCAQDLGIIRVIVVYRRHVIATIVIQKLRAKVSKT